MEKTPPLFAAERKDIILKLIETNNKVFVPDLSKKFGVSEVTIRGDLRDLESEGKLRRTYGGAISLVKAGDEPYSSEKAIQHLYEKQRIAKSALKYIEEGDTIALDAGTTTIELAKLIMEYKHLTVVTNDILISSLLEENAPGVRVFLLGGMIRKGLRCTVGPMTLECICGLHVDKAFMATNAFDASSGFTTPTLEQAEVKKSIIEISAKVIMMVDSSKSGRVSFASFADINDVDLIITDSKLSQELQEELKREFEYLEIILA